MAEDFEVGGPLPEESSNRTFVIVAAVLGGALILSIICLALYALVLAPRQRSARATEAADIILQNTRVAESITQTAQARRASPTLTPSQTLIPSPTATNTPTKVVVLPTDTPTPLSATATMEPLTATAAAQATINALTGGLTPTATATATALPTTGFADEVGVPGLLLLGGALLAVIVIARSLRTRTST